jgi:hypothetical protein
VASARQTDDSTLGSIAEWGEKPSPEPWLVGTTKVYSGVEPTLLWNQFINSQRQRAHECSAFIDWEHLLEGLWIDVLIEINLKHT